MHKLPLRVYYEDTDFGGIVYYANYLKFIERGRSEWVREMGIDQIAMKKAGVVFAVRRVEADYLSPAFYDDQLDVLTRLEKITPARMICAQQVRRGETVLFEARVTVVCIGAGGAPVRLPEILRQKLA